MTHLITPTLLNSFYYYFNFEADSEKEISEAEQEKAVRDDFLRTLSRERFAPTQAMERGNILEADVIRHSESQDGADPAVISMGDIIRGGMFQVAVSAVLDDKWVLYGKIDVVKQDTGYDIKSTGTYDIGKYQDSAQHRIYLYCSKLPNFGYLVTDPYRKNWWREDYHNHEGIEQEIRKMISDFTGYLESDPEAKELFYTRWESLAS